MNQSNILREQIINYYQTTYGELFEQFDPAKLEEAIQRIIAGKVGKTISIYTTSGKRIRTDVDKILNSIESGLRELNSLNNSVNIALTAAQEEAEFDSHMLQRRLERKGAFTAAEQASRGALNRFSGYTPLIPVAKQQQQEPTLRDASVLGSVLNNPLVKGGFEYLDAEERNRIRTAEEVKRKEEEIAEIRRKAAAEENKAAQERLRNEEQLRTQQEKNKKLQEKEAAKRAKEEYKAFLGRSEGYEDALREDALRSNPRTQQALLLAQKYGQQRGVNYDIQSSLTEASSGITRINFGGYNQQTGVFEKLSVTVDRFGRTLTDTQRRFRGFADNVTRDIQEVFKWSIAVGLVYGPLNKLQELVKIAIENDSKLADVTIALGDAQRTVNQIFTDAAKIAQISGESINGVLEGYVQATRATGNIQNPIERTTAANKLLADSLVLSKLSALNQADAIDVLSGALRQVQQPGESTAQAFARGTELLDKWVATTKAANVDLASLATSFSIAGEAAENAGLSFEQTNALVAVLSEKLGSMGPKEIGNAMRQVVGGVYTDAAAKNLQQLGISIVDVNGKTREFYDILLQIYDMNQKGLISEDNMNKLALAWGGGVRGQQRVLSVLTGVGRMNEIVAAQSNSNGAAQDALAIKLDTVQSAATRLNNGFQILAQSLGTSGGVVDSVKFLTDAATGLVGVLTTLSDLLGTAGPVITGLGLLKVAFPGKNNQITDLLGNTLSKVAYPFMGLSKGVEADYNLARISPGFAGGTKKELMQMRADAFGAANAGKLGSMAAITFMAGIQGAKGDWAGAAAIFSTNLISAINPVLGLISASIVAGVVNSIQESMQVIGTEAVFVTDDEKWSPAERANMTAQQRIFQAQRDIFGTPDALFALLTDASSGIVNFSSSILSPGAKKINRTEMALAFLAQKDPELARSIMLERELAGGGTSGLSTAFTNRVTGYTKQELIDQISQQTLTSTRQEYYQPGTKVSSREFLTRKKAIEGFGTSLPNLTAAMGVAFESLGKDIGDVTDEYETFAEIMTKGTDDQISEITAMAAQITDLYNKIAYAEANGLTTLVDGTSIKDARAQLQGLASDFEVVVSKASKQIDISNTVLPGNVDMRDYTKQQFESLILPAALEQRESFWSQLTPEELALAQAQEQMDKFVAIFKDGADRYLGISEQWLSQGEKFVQESGKLIPSNVGLSTYEDVTLEQWNQMLALYPAAKERLAQGGYTANESWDTYVLADAITGPAHLDSQIIQLLLQDIKDIEQKQLDGMYNLPEGATFMVPLGAAGLRPTGSAGDPLSRVLALLEKLLAPTGQTPPEPVEVVPNRGKEYPIDLQAAVQRIFAAGIASVTPGTGVITTLPDTQEKQSGGTQSTSAPDPDKFAYEYNAGRGTGSRAWPGGPGRKFEDEDEWNRARTRLRHRAGKAGLMSIAPYDLDTDVSETATADRPPDWFTAVTRWLKETTQPVKDVVTDIRNTTKEAQIDLMRNETTSPAATAGAALGFFGMSLIGQLPDQDATPEGAMRTSSRRTPRWGENPPATVPTYSNPIPTAAGLGAGLATSMGTTGVTYGPAVSSTAVPTVPTQQTIPPQNVNVKPQVGLKLGIESRVQLVVDGRTLANIVKNYLSEDLLRSEGTSGSITRQVVI